MDKQESLPRNDDGTLAEYAWPGGYPLYYVDTDGSTLCPKCATESLDDDNERYRPVACDVNWEDPDMWCDQCSERIESAYAEDEDETEETGTRYDYHINLDERGEFYADVRRAQDDENGDTVFEIHGFDIFEDGFMKDKRDMEGLKEHLVILDILKERDELAYIG